MQSSKQTPSVIARLMGLDDLPSQPPIRKRQKVLSENYLRKTSSIAQSGKNVLYSRRSYGVTYDHRGSKNIVDDDIPMIDRNIQEVSDVMLHHPKEFDNILEDLQFNQDKSVRDLQQPDLLPKTQLRVQQSRGLHSSGHLGVLNSISAHSNRKNILCNNSNKATVPRSTTRSVQKLGNDSFSGHVGKFDVVNFHKLLTAQSDLKQTTQLSSRITVLRPNTGKALNLAGTSSLPGAKSTFLSRDRKNGELKDATARKGRRNDGMEQSGKIDALLEEIEEGSSKRQESKLDCSSEFDTKLIKATFQSANNWNKVEQKSCLPSKGSGLATVAKRQIFERWKTTKVSEERIAVNKICSLGEMLDISHVETNPRCVSNKLHDGTLSSLLSWRGGRLNSVNPFGISSKVGGRAENSMLLQSKLHQQPCNYPGSHKLRARSETSYSGRLSIQEEADEVELKRYRNEFFSRKCNPEQGDSKYFEKKPQRSCSLNLVNGIIQQECNSSIGSRQFSKASEVIQHKKESSFGTDDLTGDTGYSSDVLYSSIGSPASCVAEAVSGDDGPMGDTTISSSEFKELYDESTQISLVKDDDVQISETLNRQLTEMQISSNYYDEVGGFSISSRTRQGCDTNLRESNRRSPNSVLDPHFQEESVFIFQGFDRAAADFYSSSERHQLQRSKSEEMWFEGTEMFVSSDEDKGSIALFQDSGSLLRSFKVEESRNFSYLVDVLDEAGFTGINSELEFGTLHSLEYPMSPSVFESLEKMYGKLTSWEKSERRLLFDRINAGLKEVLNVSIDVKKWEKPLRKRFRDTRRRDEIEEELWTLLISEEKEACKNLSEKALSMETRWLEIREEIQDICRDIENDLFDELVGEISAIVFAE